MTTGSLSAFVDAVRASGLLEDAQRDELERALRPRFPEPQALAAELVRRGWLTPYQATRLLEGGAAELVLGQYVLLDRLGEGGMGQVFKARHRLMKRVVALKVIRPDRLADAEAAHRFRREIEAVAHLSHPNIVTAHDANQVGDVHFLVMEHVEGIDLARLVRRVGPLPVGEACEYVRQAALGLQHAHEKGLVHRDIKPSNLLVTLAGQTGPGAQPVPVVKVLDMGLALLQDIGAEGGSESALTHDGAVMGTPDYISPEQATNSHAVDIRSDLYSLGCTLYHLLAGMPPFPGGTLMEKLIKHKFAAPRPVELYRPEVPAGVAAVVRRLTAKRPEERYQTPAELAAALLPFCSLEKCSLGPLPETLCLPGPQGDASGSASTFGTFGPRAETMRPADPLQVGPLSPDAGNVPAAAAGGSAPAGAWPPTPDSAPPAGLGPWSGRSLPPAAAQPPAAPPRRRTSALPFALAAAVLLAALAVPAALYWRPGPTDGGDSSLVEAGRDDSPPKEQDRQPKPGRPPGPKGATPPAPDRDKGKARPDDGKPKDAGPKEGGMPKDGARPKDKPPVRPKLPERIVLDPETFQISQASFSRLGRYVLMYNGDKSIRLHSLDSPNPEKPVAAYLPPEAVRRPFQTLLTPEGNRTLFGLYGRPIYSEGDRRVVGAEQPYLLLLSPEQSPEEKAPFLLGEEKGISAMALHPLPRGDGLQALVGTLSGNVYWWDLNAKGGKRYRRLVGHQERPVRSLAFSPNGRLAASGTTNGEVCLWDLGQLGDELLVAFRPHQRAVTCLAFLREGKALLTGSQDDTLCRWDIHDPAAQPRLDYACRHDSPVTCVAVDANFERALTGGENGRVRLWDLESGKEADGFGCRHGTSAVLAVAFDPRGYALSVAGGKDNSIRRKPLPSRERPPE
ncbi:MAG TPA: WD40 repeat domain-containing serine/threonine protein kinase [Gemmataceae bacterium]|nr:WD40 repeat domain-containing serine/threonine protein kinase [Gemmataceae bacterium]